MSMSMRVVKESSVVAAIQKAVKKEYPSAYCVKLADRFRRGLPDLLVCFRIKTTYVVLPAHWSKSGSEMTRDFFGCGTIFIEAKRPRGGRLSAIQRAEAEKIAALGASGLDWLCATSPEEVLAKMREMGAVP